MTTWFIHRRQALQWGVASLLGAAAATGSAHAQGGPDVEVWKDPSCGCCKDWIAHLEQNGFPVQAHDVGRDAARARLGLPDQYASCHTALIGGYVIEGHVAADEIRRLLRERPEAIGLAAPGMPVGAPGMDGAVYGGRRDAYDTLLVLRDGSSRVFVRHAGA